MDSNLKIKLLKSQKAQIAKLGTKARETSFLEHWTIKSVYKDILGIRFIDHFSINVVDKNEEMFIFSINPEIAYNLYKNKKNIADDLAISPTFYKNLDFYFWADCYMDNRIMVKKELKFGIKAGAVFVHRDDNVTYLLSLATKGNQDNFKQNMITDQDYYRQMGQYCIAGLQEKINIYINQKKLAGSIYEFAKKY